MQSAVSSSKGATGSSSSSNEQQWLARSRSPLDGLRFPPLRGAFPVLLTLAARKPQSKGRNGSLPVGTAAAIAAIAAAQPPLPGGAGPCFSCRRAALKCLELPLGVESKDARSRPP
jgi:hypothetical protein